MYLALSLVFIVSAISIHEMGHAIAMRDCGVKVRKISLLGVPGLGTINLPISWEKFPGTQWVVHPFIIGAYVLADDEELEKLAPYDRAYVSAAGPYANVLYAIALLGVAVADFVIRGLATRTEWVLVSVVAGAFVAIPWVGWKLRRYLSIPACAIMAILIIWLLGSLILSGNFFRDAGGPVTIVESVARDSAILEEKGYGLIASAAMFGVMISISLAIFNSLPIVPLDGGHIVRAYLRANTRLWYEVVTGVAAAALIIVILGADLWKLVGYGRRLIGL